MSCSYSPVMVTISLTVGRSFWQTLLTQTGNLTRLVAGPEVTWDWIGFPQYSALLFILPMGLMVAANIVNKTKPKVVSEFVV